MDQYKIGRFIAERRKQKNPDTGSVRRKGRRDQQDRLKMGDRKVYAGSGHDFSTL